MGILGLIEEHQYRDQTHSQRSMAGVMSPSFRCIRCKGTKSILGRKKAAQGYRCAGCVSEIQAAKQAKDKSDE